LCQVRLSKGLILTQKTTRLQIVFRVIEMYSFCNICALHKKHLQVFSQDEVKRTKHLAIASSCFQRPLSCWNNSELNVVQNIHMQYTTHVDCLLISSIFKLYLPINKVSGFRPISSDSGKKSPRHVAGKMHRDVHTNFVRPPGQ